MPLLFVLLIAACEPIIDLEPEAMNTWLLGRYPEYPSELVRSLEETDSIWRWQEEEEHQGVEEQNSDKGE